MKIKSKREVILSCGVYKSPQLLELSGIGDPDILQSAGVECVIPLPGVGRSLQDHGLTGSMYELADGVESLETVQKPEVQAEHGKVYTRERKGALAAASCCMGFLPYATLVSPSELDGTCRKISHSSAKTPFQQKQLEQVARQLRDRNSANLQLALLSATSDIEKGATDRTLLIKRGGTDTGRDSLTIVACLQYPASRGSVHITSANPTVDPAIDPAYLTHPSDVAILAAGLELIERVIQSPMLRDQIRRRIQPEPFVNLSDRKQAETEVWRRCMTEYHPCGSCAMGDVVDERLKVKGVRGLRVVDASVFLGHVSGNILSTVYAVAENGADLIKDDEAASG